MQRLRVDSGMIKTRDKPRHRRLARGLLTIVTPLLQMRHVKPLTQRLRAGRGTRNEGET